MRLCSKCKIEKNNNEYRNEKTRNGQYRFRNACKKCERERVKKYLTDNKAIINEKKRNYYKRNSTKIIAQLKKSRKKRQFVPAVIKSRACKSCKVLKDASKFQFERNTCKQCCSIELRIKYGEDIKRLKRKYWHRDKDKINQERRGRYVGNELVKEKNRNRQRLERNNLADTYIKHNLKNQGFPESIANSKHIIENRRLLIKYKRFIYAKKKNQSAEKS